MGNNGSSGIPLNFVCFRCDRVIKPHKKMFTVSVSIDAVAEDGSIESSHSCVISSLCFGCAYILLAEAAISKNIVMPKSAV